MAGATAPRTRGVRGLVAVATPRYVAAVIAVPVLALAGVVAAGDIRGLTYVHVMAGATWTGIDLGMGLVIGPVLRRLDPDARAGFFTWFTPKMTFLMPTLSIVTIVAGITLALTLGYFPHAGPWLALFTAAHLPIIPLIAVQFGRLTDPRTLAVLGAAVAGTGAWLAVELPAFAMTDPWIAASLGVVTLLSLIGLGVLLPGEIRIYLESISPDPDRDEISRVGLRNASLSGVQGALQLTIIYVMVHLRF